MVLNQKITQISKASAKSWLRYIPHSLIIYNSLYLDVEK